MASTTCPHCGVFSNLTYRWGQSGQHGVPYVLDVAYTCDSCQRVLSARLPTKERLFDASRMRGAVDRAQAERTLTWLPHLLHVPDHIGVPEEIGAAATEAHRSIGIGNFRAAILMARSTLEAAAKDHEATGNSLYSRIQSMQKAGILTQHITDLAHAIRDWGNDMAHGDFSQTVDRDDAQDLLSLMDAVLESLYRHKATLANLQQRRA